MTKNKLKAFYSLFIIILTGVIFLFSSCGGKSYTVLIKNESSNPVKYSYNDESNILTPGTFKSYVVDAFTQQPKDINTLDNAGDVIPMSVKMIAAGDVFTFVDL